MIRIPYFRGSGKLERARGIGHVPIIKSEFIQKKLQDFHVITRKKIDKLPNNLVFNLKDEINAQSLPDYIISFDGSGYELEIDEKFPSTRIGYIQIAAVLVFLKKMLDLRTQQFIDPLELRKMINESLFSMVLPGSNIRENKCNSLKDSWRWDIYQIFKEYKIENQRLLDIFWEIVECSGQIDEKNKKIFNNKIRLHRCPASDKCNGPIDIPKEGLNCPECGGALYPTDILRIHEEVKELQPNEGPLHRIMNLLEHINLIAYLRYLIKRRPEVLNKIAFIIDGPLALFGPTAWVHRAIFNYINGKIYQTLASKKIEYPVIVGIEKTGNFVEHAEVISKFLKSQALMVLTEDYIYQYILSTIPQSGIYGSETYYGQKVFYKTKTNQILTITIPRLKLGKSSKEILNHPALLRTLKLLDNICLLYTSPSPRDLSTSRMPSSA